MIWSRSIRSLVSPQTFTSFVHHIVTSTYRKNLFFLLFYIQKVGKNRFWRLCFLSDYNTFTHWGCRKVITKWDDFLKISMIRKHTVRLFTFVNDDHQPKCAHDWIKGNMLKHLHILYSSVFRCVFCCCYCCLFTFSLRPNNHWVSLACPNPNTVDVSTRQRCIRSLKVNNRLRWNLDGEQWARRNVSTHQRRCRWTAVFVQKLHRGKYKIAFRLNRVELYFSGFLIGYSILYCYTRINTVKLLITPTARTRFGWTIFA